MGLLGMKPWVVLWEAEAGRSGMHVQNGTACSFGPRALSSCISQGSPKEQNQRKLVLSQKIWKSDAFLFCLSHSQLESATHVA